MVCLRCVIVYWVRPFCCLMRAQISSISSPIESNKFIISQQFRNTNSNLELGRLMDTGKWAQIAEVEAQGTPINSRPQHNISNKHTTINNGIKSPQDRQSREGAIFTSFQLEPRIASEYLPPYAANRYSLKPKHNQNKEVSKDSNSYYQRFESLQKERDVLIEANTKLQAENVRLKNKNTYLEAAMAQFIDDLKSESKGKVGCDGSMNEKDVLKLRENTIPSTEYQVRLSKLKKIIQFLQQQNYLLIQYKNACMKKIKQFSQRVEELKQELRKQKQKGSSKGQKLQQVFRMYNQDKQKIQLLQEQLRNSNGELHKVLKDAKIRDEQIGYAHEKFHRQMMKMKQKAQRYKQKSQSYRKQRDELAIQIQRAKLQIGTVTLRKYFPDDSDG